MSPAAASPLRRAVFISDVHLGSRHCHAAELAEFLSTLRCTRMVAAIRCRLGNAAKAASALARKRS